MARQCVLVNGLQLSGDHEAGPKDMSKLRGESTKGRKTSDSPGVQDSSLPSGSLDSPEMQTRPAAASRGRGRGGIHTSPAGRVSKPQSENTLPGHIPVTQPTRGKVRDRGRAKGALRKPRITKAGRERMEAEKAARENATAADKLNPTEIPEHVRPLKITGDDEERTKAKKAEQERVAKKLAYLEPNHDEDDEESAPAFQFKQEVMPTAPGGEHQEAGMNQTPREMGTTTRNPEDNIKQEDTIMKDEGSPNNVTGSQDGPDVDVDKDDELLRLRLQENLLRQQMRKNELQRKAKGRGT